MQNKLKKDNPNYKTLLNFLLIFFFIYIAYIIEQSPLQRTRKTIYLLLGCLIILLFIQINFSKDSLLKIKEKLTFKKHLTPQKDEVRDFIE